MPNYTLQQEDSNSDSDERAKQKKLEKSKQKKKKKKDDEEGLEVCTSVRIYTHLHASACICMHLYASVCIKYSSVLYHHCVGSIARARSLSQVR